MTPNQTLVSVIPMYLDGRLRLHLVYESVAETHRIVLPAFRGRI